MAREVHYGGVMRRILTAAFIASLAVVVFGGSSACSSDEPCEVSGDGPGVKITIRSDSCAYDRGDPAVFRYEITTTEEVPEITVQASQGCGSCRKATPEHTSWTSWQISGTSSDGQSQRYCRCDTGCCAPDEAAVVKPRATTSTGTIEWSGRTWGGPSDTGQKEGDFFAPGRYEVVVQFAGLATARLPIEITD